LNIWWWWWYTSYCPQTNRYGHLRHLKHRQALIHAISRRRKPLVKRVRNGFLKFYLYFSKQLAAERTFVSEIKVPLQK
jgi:hypothetical protein